MKEFITEEFTTRAERDTRYAELIQIKPHVQKSTTSKSDNSGMRWVVAYPSVVIGRGPKHGY